MSLNYEKYGIPKVIPKIYANRITINKKDEFTQIAVKCNVLFDFPSFDDFVNFCSNDCYDYSFENYLFYYSKDPKNSTKPAVFDAFESNEINTKVNDSTLKNIELNQVSSNVVYDSLNASIGDNLKKYSRELPNGQRYYQLSYTVLYEIPSISKSEGSLENVYFLSNVVVKELPSIMDTYNFGDFVNYDLDLINSIPENFIQGSQNFEDNPIRGPITVETIISNGNVKDEGFVYSISDDQSTPDAAISPNSNPAAIADQDTKRDQKFSSLKGTVWLGEVHVHGNRYMAGATHNLMYPYLDLTFIPNEKIIDLAAIDILGDNKVEFSSIFDDIKEDFILDNGDLF